MTPNGSRLYGRWTLWLLPVLLTGCTGMWPRWFTTALPPPETQPLALVAPVAVEASVTHVSQIYSVDDAASEDQEPQLRAQLLDELALHAQRVLTAHLAKRSEMRVLAFAETRRLGIGSPPTDRRWTDDELAGMGRSAGADIVIAARIHDYGRLGWRHWVYGWLGVASTHTAIVGAATAWNPLAMGAYLAYDLATDLPLWYGGAYVLGWAFRPVHVEVDAVQLTPCTKRTWYDQEVTVIAGRKALAGYPDEQRRRKEIQLQVNLDQALATLAEAAGRTLRLQPCQPTEQGAAHAL